MKAYHRKENAQPFSHHQNRAPASPEPDLDVDWMNPGISRRGRRRCGRGGDLLRCVIRVLRPGRRTWAQWRRTRLSTTRSLWDCFSAEGRREPRWVFYGVGPDVTSPYKPWRRPNLFELA